MIKMIKKLGRSNAVVKPLGVATASAPPLSYLLTQPALLNELNIDGEDFVAVSKELIKSLQGIMILLVLLIAIIYIYKPPKIVIFSLMFGGIMIFASSLFYMLGITFLLFGLGLVFNSFTINKLVARNNKLYNKKEDIKINNIIGGL